MMQIGIALVERDGFYLVGERGLDAPLAGYSEFPGGKCRPGESPADCAVRECLEETGLRVEVRGLRRIVTHHYEHGPVELHFYDCKLREGQEADALKRPFHWVRADQLADFHFPPANDQVVQELLCRAAGAEEAP
jgi:8-oxo-dGTP diphosphatase